MNKIIVESKNDQIFVQALVENMNINNTQVEKILIGEESFTTLGSLDPNPLKPSNLILKLKDIKTEIPKKGISRIGVLVDRDKSNLEDRFLMINTALRDVFGEDSLSEITKENTLVKVNIDDYEIEVLCYFTNVDESGDLETLLRSIKTQDSPHADCLESWRDCLREVNIKIKQKDFDKFWISNYIRFDTCLKKERADAGNKCSMSRFDYVMENKSQIFDLNHENLEGLRAFLSLFN